jgi:hypothetical protein
VTLAAISRRSGIGLGNFPHRLSVQTSRGTRIALGRIVERKSPPDYGGHSFQFRAEQPRHFVAAALDRLQPEKLFMLKDHQDPVYGSAVAPQVPIPRTSFSWDEGPLQVSANDLPQPKATAAAGDVHRDLCCVCTYQSQCMYRGTPQQPKLCCELFDVDVPSLAVNERDDASIHSSGDAAFVKGGLCCNCGNRRHCAIRAPEGDVWHCEEYC